VTNEEKAKRLEDMALIPVFLDRQDEALLREAAAHFRSLVTDKNGLLPCPMCGPHGKPTITGTFRRTGSLRSLARSKATLMLSARLAPCGRCTTWKRPMPSLLGIGGEG
jgi:hypothetical protein